jgi:Rrf2 family transcriptional regulator, iron-sulfur cluster assembly transcription factor
MAIIFSKGCEYGIQATLYIGVQKERRVGIREISEALNIPVHFLAKILQALSEKHILASYKGSKGGFTLNTPPGEIHIIEIVEAIDGMDLFHNCVLGFPDCKDSHPCPAHASWGAAREILHTMLSTETLADLMATSEKKISAVKRKIGRKKTT